METWVRFDYSTWKLWRIKTDPNRGFLRLNAHPYLHYITVLVNVSWHKNNLGLCLKLNPMTCTYQVYNVLFQQGEIYINSCWCGFPLSKSLNIAYHICSLSFNTNPKSSTPYIFIPSSDICCLSLQTLLYSTTTHSSVIQKTPHNIVSFLSHNFHTFFFVAYVPVEKQWRGN